MTTRFPVPFHDGIDDGLVGRVRRFAQTSLLGEADGIDATGFIPPETWQELSELGLLTLVVPQELGGLGANMATSAAVISELSRVSVAIGNIIAVSGTTQMPYLLAGTDEQRERVLGQLVRERGVACASFTERGAGSDLNAMATRAERVPGGWVLNGSKIYGLHGGIAKVFCIWASSDEGITAFIVPRGASGMTVGEDQPRMGLHGVTVVEIYLEEVFVPEEDVLGQPGRGLAFGLQTINKGRLDVGAQCVGLARAALDYVIDYLERREQFGTPVIEFQAVQMRLADMSCRLEGAELMVRRAAVALDSADQRAVRYCAEVKVASSEMAVSLTSDALMLMGGYGYLKEHPIERLARDAVVYRLLDGTNDINRLRVVAELRKERRAVREGRG